MEQLYIGDKYLDIETESGKLEIKDLKEFIKYAHE